VFLTPCSSTLAVSQTGAFLYHYMVDKQAYKERSILLVSFLPWKSDPNAIMMLKS